MCDFLLGGKDSYPADRAACEALVEVLPNAAALAETQKAFSLAAVDRLFSQHGVRQFLDLGCGLPAWVNTHQVAGASRVVYIDKDPMVVAHGRVLLDGGARTAVVQGDLMEGGALLDHPQITRLIDFDQPVAVMMTSVLHCIADDERPAAALRSLLERLATGSYLVLSQWVSEDPGLRDRVGKIMRRSTAGAWGQVRTRAAVDELFSHLLLEQPGLGDVSAWARVEHGPASSAGVVEYGGVGRLQR
jgi:SAM-dependent methyltransferase